MAKEVSGIIKLQIKGGAANPSPPVGPAPDAPAVQTDVLERPLPANTAAFHNGVLTVDLPAFGMVTVQVG